MQKEKRQSAILELISENRIARQEELAAMLESRGFSVTQSSVSRDLLDLGIVKVAGAYARPVAQRPEMTFGVKSLEVAGDSLVVAKTESGLASACAVRIDAESIDEIVGTVAGDDTIFIAVRDSKAQKTVLRRVWEIFEN
jgi:transcriptional regulator of arginine metabolism